MAINDYALHTIEGAQTQEPNTIMRVLWPFGGEPPSRAAALDAFQRSMDVHASELQRLILEAEVIGAMCYQRVELDEGAGIEQQLEPLARGELAHRMLPIDARRPTTEQRLRANAV